jgi:hypothetical protein
MLYFVNGHSVSYVYQGLDSWVLDGGAVYFHLGQLARACGVSVEELKAAIDY